MGARLVRRRWPSSPSAGLYVRPFSSRYFRAADARELLVQVQTSDDVPAIRDELVADRGAGSEVAGRRKQPLVLQVDSWGGTGWPWSWYLRDVPAGYYDMSRPDLVDPRAGRPRRRSEPRGDGTEAEGIRRAQVPAARVVGPGLGRG